MQFREIIGQEKIKAQLIQTVQENRVSHAQLFLSPTGSGGLPLALAYAQYINCLDRNNEDSCGICNNCRKYEKLIHPDLHFSYPFFAKGKEDVAKNYLAEWRQCLGKDIYFDLDDWRGYHDAGNKQPNINIAECHDIIKKLSYKAFEAPYKVLIMWLPEFLDTQGNTLLKLIEEPPANTLFILIAQNQEQILSTILSRTQLLKIPKLRDEELKDYLMGQMNFPQSQAEEFAFLADGNMVEVQKLIADKPSDNAAVFANWLRMGYSNKVLELIQFTDELASWGRENQKNFLRYGINFLRECCLLMHGVEHMVKMPPLTLETAKKLATHVLTVPMAEALTQVLEQAHYHVERNANPKILFLDVSLQLVKIIKFKTFPQGTQYI